MKKYIFRKYTPKYLKLFSSEKKRIIKALGSTVKIEQVGSTAIASLGGKGIVDIIVGVSKVKLQETKRKLEMPFATSLGLWNFGNFRKAST